MRTYKFFAAMAILFPAISFAEGMSNIPQADQQANAVTRLYMDACAANVPDEAKLKTWIQQNGLRPTEPSFSQKILNGQKGEVWSVKSQIGNFIIVTGSPYHCAVWARRANARLVLEHFQKLAKAVERSGLSVTLEKDSQMDGQGGKYRQIVYMLRKPDVKTGRIMIASVSESTEAEVQVRLTLALAK